MAAQYATRATDHSTSQNIRGEMVFGRDKLHPFSNKVNWSQLVERKQDIIDCNNVKENNNRKHFIITKKVTKYSFLTRINKRASQKQTALDNPTYLYEWNCVNY